MTKADLVEQVAVVIGPRVTKRACGLVVDAFLDAVKDALARGDRIELRLAPALETIASLDGPFGFVFVDADKGNYPAYYDAVLPKLADGGLIAFDNVLWSGRVLDDEDQTVDTKAIRALNEQLARDDRIECVMLTVRDGLTLVRRRDSR